MYSSSWCLVFIAVATAATAVVTDPKPAENPQPTSTLSPTSASPNTDPEEDPTSSGPRKRTIEQTVGYGYRYNTVLRPVSSGSTVVASLSRNRPTNYQRASASPMTPSPTPASYYFQQQVQSTSPKPLHRFNSPFPTPYPRYNRPEPSETRPVTENPLPGTATATLQPHQDIYREVFTFDEAVSSPYHIAPRAEQPSILPQALFLTPAGPHLPGHQQVIPVLILRLDTASSYPYPMMAILREDLMSKMYSQHDPALQLQQYVDPGIDGAYYSPESQQQARRVQPMTPSQPDPYRGAQEQLVVGKVPIRRPSPGTSAGSGSSQGARTEVTIHHSPGMTAQDYKESLEQEDETA